MRSAVCLAHPAPWDGDAAHSHCCGCLHCSVKLCQGGAATLCHRDAAVLGAMEFHEGVAVGWSNAQQWAGLRLQGGSLLVTVLQAGGCDAVWSPAEHNQDATAVIQAPDTLKLLPLTQQLVQLPAGIQAG